MRRRDRDGVYERKGTFWISWTDDQGRRHRRRTSAKTKQEARAARAAELQRVEKAKALGFMPPGEDAFGSVADRFLKHQKPRLSKRAYEREELIVNRHLKPFFSGRIAAIRQSDVEQYVTERSSKVSAHTIHKELQAIKHLLRMAVSWQIIPVNPAHSVKSPKVPPGRIRYLQAAEFRLLLVNCPNWLRPIAALAVSTGMRLSEILNLRWIDIDLNHQSILLPQTKNGESRIVYLNQMATSVLTSLDSPQKSTDRLFHVGSPNRVSVAFSRACRKVGIENFRFHDLRHTAASWLRMKGADIHTVAQLLGHKDLRMAARYQHLSPAYLAEAVGKLDGVFGDVSDVDRHHSVTTHPALEEGETVST